MCDFSAIQAQEHFRLLIREPGSPGKLLEALFMSVGVHGSFASLRMTFWQMCGQGDTPVSAPNIELKQEIPTQAKIRLEWATQLFTLVGVQGSILRFAQD